VTEARPSYPRLWRAQEGTLSSSWRSAARRFNLKGVPGAQPSYPRSWRTQEGTLPSSWRSAARRFNLKGVRGTAFLPKIMENPRGSSAIIMEISRSSIQFTRCARGTAFLPKIMEIPRGSSAIIMEFRRRTHLIYDLFVLMCVMFEYLRVCVSLLSHDSD